MLAHVVVSLVRSFSDVLQPGVRVRVDISLVRLLGMPHSETSAAEPPREPPR